MQYKPTLRGAMLNNVQGILLPLLPPTVVDIFWRSDSAFSRNAVIHSGAEIIE